MSTLKRIWRHYSTGRWHVRQRIPASTQRAVEQAVRDCERLHSGEIRVAIEATLPMPAILAGLSARERAVEVFSQLRIWDTEQRNGVLIYLLYADRAVEIVADRGVSGERVAQHEWDTVCRAMQAEFRAGHFEPGLLAGVQGVADVLARHTPGVRSGRNELPDAPILL